jgi:CheY-like chemotaxis protein
VSCNLRIFLTGNIKKSVSSDDRQKKGIFAMKEKEILIVDDDSVIRHLFEKAFSKAGYHVQTAESAEAALNILKQKEFYVMFLDLKLPGMTGLELCKKIKPKNPRCFIYAITAYASVFELADCLEAGFDDYFTKPADLDILFEATQNAFDQIERWEQGA